MFGDTLTITIDSVEKVLNKINQDGYSSEYLLKESTGEFRLAIRNTSYQDKKRGGVTISRHNVELSQTIYPLVAGGISTVRRMYTVIEDQQADVSDDVADFGVGLVGFHTKANLLKLMNFES